MSTKHSKAAEKFLQDSKMAAWHNETLWMVRAKRDKMSKEVPEWEELRNKACELKLYSNSHLEELLLEFEKNATANGAIVHWAKDADEYCAIVYEILNEHNVHHFIKSKSMLAEECGLNPFLMERGIDFAKKAGFEQLELGVFADNDRALCLYKKMGFEEIGRIPRAFRLPDGSYIDEITMVKML